MKDYKTLEANVFCKPFDKKGCKVRLKEKTAADYVKKGSIELIETVKKPTKKVSEPKAPQKEVKAKKAPEKD